MKGKEKNPPNLGLLTPLEGHSGGLQRAGGWAGQKTLTPRTSLVSGPRPQNVLLLPDHLSQNIRKGSLASPLDSSETSPKEHPPYACPLVVVRGIATERLHADPLLLQTGSPPELVCRNVGLGGGAVGRGEAGAGLAAVVAVPVVHSTLVAFRSCETQDVGSQPGPWVQLKLEDTRTHVHAPQTVSE